MSTQIQFFVKLAPTKENLEDLVSIFSDIVNLTFLVRMQGFSVLNSISFVHLFCLLIEELAKVT